MATKDKLIDYVLTTPHNTNKKVLEGLIDTLIKESSGEEKVSLRLIDWEGTTLGEYSKEKVLALTELPVPSSLEAYNGVDHELLVFQEWNWSLTDIKKRIQDHEDETLLVGAIYTTIDGQDHDYWNNPRLSNANLISTKKKGVTSIENNAFGSCIALSSINIPSGVTSIGSYAFGTCPCLSSINIPSEVTSIGDNAFNDCRTLSSISIPNEVTSIGSYAFSSCYSLSSINIPSGVTNIGSYAFSNCYSLSSINIPNEVTSIGSYAFDGCNSLSSINIPNDVTSIGSYVFHSCYSLSSINIPSSITSIENRAFGGCYCLADILLEGTPALSNINAFGNNPTVQKFYVPRLNLSWFETATNWSTLYSKFVAIEDNIDYLESIGFNVDAYKT